MKFANAIILVALNLSLLACAMEEELDNETPEIKVTWDKFYKLNRATNENEPEAATFYLHKSLVDKFNTLFQANIQYNEPFVSVLLGNKDSFQRKDNNFHCEIDIINEDKSKETYSLSYPSHLSIRWNAASNGIPLAFLALKSFKIETDANIYCYQRSSDEHINLQKIKEEFQKNPMASSIKQGQATINQLLEAAIIEKDGEHYKHGPNGYFAQE